MSEETVTVCPTLAQLLLKQASSPIVAFSLGVLATNLGPAGVDLIRKVLGI